jgi:hypothetical protein
MCTDREIRQALTHKARLRKKYIKELEKSGESIPDKESRQQQRERINDNEVKRPSFQERQQIAKERKKQLREEREKQNMERQEMVEKKRKDRERKKDQLSQTTRTGQPLMGPRISNLLEKIEKEYGDKV